MIDTQTITASVFIIMSAAYAINAIIILKFKNSLLILLSSINISILLIPVFFQNFNNYSQIFHISGFIIYLAFYPFYLIQNFNPYLRIYYKYFLAIPVFTLIMLHFSVNYNIIALIALLMLYIGLLALFSLMKDNDSKKILQFIVIFSIIISAVSLTGNNNHAILFLPALSYIVSFIADFVNYKRKVNTYLKQLNKSYEINMKTIHQITRLQQSNDQFRRIIEEKDQELLQISRHASLAEITTGIGHEIAQPLTGIKGIAQNMIDDINYEEFDKLQAIADLTKISVLVDKASTIINHIRNFSRKSGFNKKPVNINNAIKSALELVNLQLEKNEIALTLSLHEQISTIKGDSLSIEQVVVNTILNAKDALIEKRNIDKTFIPHISVATYNEDNHVILEIEDNGTGIPKEIISKIWSPFFTSKKRMNGTGMGLSISKKIIHEHDGTVSLDTGDDFTRFTFSFPVFLN